MLPFFLETPVTFIKNKYNMNTGDFIFGSCITLVVIMIFLAIASVTRVSYVDIDGSKICKTLLGENIDCHKN